MSARSPRPRRFARQALLCGFALSVPASCLAQISLPAAVDLALRTDPHVKVAEADLYRAKAVLAETKEAYVPAVTTEGSVGKATGAPLSPPVVFSIGAQSLVFNFSQNDYVRAAHSGLSAAQLALEAARSNAAEDVTATYVTLDNALQRREVQQQALALAVRLVTIVQERFTAGVDPHIDLTKARRTEAQIRLAELLVEDEIAEQTQHLAHLTGLTATRIQTVHSSIPRFQPPAPTTAGDAPDPRDRIGVSAAFAAAQAKAYTAHGERRYLLRPQISFSANYSRISTAFTTYDLYYPGFDEPNHSFNSLGFGVQISVPLLDMVHRARAREAEADSRHAFFDAQLQQNQFLESRRKLHRSATELAARAELATLDHDLAQDQLDAVLTRLRPVAGLTGGDQLTPKDEENARLDERRRTLDMLDADLQLQQAEISLLRQEGSLATWLAATIPSATAAPAGATPDTRPGLPPTLGTEPGSAPIGSPPTTLPSTGTSPSSLPSAPTSSAPSPTTTTPAPPTTPHP